MFVAVLLVTINHKYWGSTEVTNTLNVQLHSNTNYNCKHTVPLIYIFIIINSTIY